MGLTIQYLKQNHCHNVKKRCKAVAKDLGYGYDVVDAIKQAKSNDEIDRIMIDARRRQE